MTLTFKEVADILKIIDASSCDEVVLDLQGIRLEVRRGAAGVAPSAPAVRTAAPIPSTPAAPAARVAAPPAQAASATVAEGQIAVRAPMVGTFYRKPGPNEQAFVEVGQRVRKGDPLCLIEVMKLYTTIEAPADGVVAAISAEDGALVEFDRLLFVIEA